MARIKIVCSRCGSDDVTRDGILTWSVSGQCWEVCSELDATNCNACDGDEVDLDEVDLDEGEGE